MLQELIDRLEEELQSVEEDDKDNSLEGIDWHEDALAEAWRNGYSRALFVVKEYADDKPKG